MRYYRFVCGGNGRNYYLKYDGGVIRFIETYGYYKFTKEDVPEAVNKLFDEYMLNPFYEIDLKRFIEQRL